MSNNSRFIEESFPVKEGKSEWGMLFAKGQRSQSEMIRIRLSYLFIYNVPYVEIHQY